MRWVTRRAVPVVALVCALAATAPVPARVGEPVCVETPRPARAKPVLAAERASFGFHDEELIICSPGYREPTHLAARLFVPAECVTPGSCPGILITHGFGFTKELTIPDMQNLVHRGFSVLSYDVRGHGASGGQVALMGREEIADEAAVLAWFHAHVKPKKVGVYGISQGGSHAFMAAIFNCGSERAAHFDSTIPCDAGTRWVDAIAPVQGPTTFESDGTCPVFALEATPESRFDPELTRDALRCSVAGTPLAGPVAAVTDSLPGFDASIRDYLARAGRVDVPAYLATGFFDRLVLPQEVTTMYELLRARVNDPSDPYKKDLRLLISNDSHGTIGGNFAALNDVFNWFEWQLKGFVGPPRDAPVAIAQEWANNTFRLEQEWPIPGTTERTLYLSHSGAGSALTDATPAHQPPDRLRNVPVLASPPEVPFVNGVQLPRAVSLPGTRLEFLTAPFPSTAEITGLPRVSIWVSSSNRSNAGVAQLHVALAEVAADGTVTEFARHRRGVFGLGPKPVEVSFPLTVSSHRIDAGNRLMLVITPSDIAETVPFITPDVTFVHHDATDPSGLVIPLAPVDRVPPAGPVPTGPAFPGDALQAICEGLGLPCPN